MEKITIAEGKKTVAKKAFWNKAILDDWSDEELLGYTYDIYYDLHGRCSIRTKLITAIATELGSKLTRTGPKPAL